MLGTPSATDFNSMTPEQKIENSFRYLCLRLLDIDNTCSREKGCAYSFAAQPMIEAWQQTHAQHELPASVAEPLRRMVMTYDDGRACPFGEIKYHAQTFLDSE